ncbi:hypothetical protein NUW54_g2863 [Trametes sanguinea]|uniref:Uncharacterized protein n=1 Tax=Trametes sanguinea TaxID=158606 RepID=A0ACC1Q2B5_9APHY|nr:hypothetical protein NUW54_g2863 [Trametes sanguinea]
MVAFAWNVYVLLFLSYTVFSTFTALDVGSVVRVLGGWSHEEACSTPCSLARPSGPSDPKLSVIKLALAVTLVEQQHVDKSQWQSWLRIQLGNTDDTPAFQVLSKRPDRSSMNTHGGRYAPWDTIVINRSSVTTFSIMSIPTQHYALYLEKKQGTLEIKQLDVPELGPEDFLVRVEAAALNPADWKILDHGIIVDKYPAILGFDGAGVVVKVGSAVKGFAVGDRVLVQTGTLPEDGTMIGTFQQYMRVRPTWATKIPANLSFEEAATVPSGVASSALPLYSRDAGAQSAKLIAPYEEGGRGRYAATSW